MIKSAIYKEERKDIIHKHTKTKTWKKSSTAWAQYPHYKKKNITEINQVTLTL